MQSHCELKAQIRVDLRLQHPEWISANGECPLCDEYELRLAALLASTVEATGCSDLVETAVHVAAPIRGEMPETIVEASDR
jgi:hypothetical protein